MTADIKPLESGNDVEVHTQPEAEDIEDAEDDLLNSEAPGAGKFFDGSFHIDPQRFSYHVSR